MMNPATMYMSITAILSIHRMLYVASASLAPRWGGGCTLVSSDGDDRRIFLGLKFSILRFLGKKNWQVFFGWLDLNENVMMRGERKLRKKF